MLKWKVFQTIDEDSNRRYIIATEDVENIDIHLKLGEEIETTCWLSDVLTGANENIFIVPQSITSPDIDLEKKQAFQAALYKF